MDQEETVVALLGAKQVSFSKKYKSVISVKLIIAYNFKNLILLLLTAFLLTSCSSEDKTGGSRFSGNDAIAKVVREERSDFPLEASRVKGTIHGGGPVPGITIPGEFESSVTKKENDVYIVTLTEYWKAEDFRDSEHKKGTLSAYWKYEVSPTAIIFLDKLWRYISRAYRVA